MNKWFYAKDGQAIGPLSTPEMHELIGQGTCTRTTLVWTRGMRDWLPACMAAWMWEERAERQNVTTPDGTGHGHDHADGGMANGRVDDGMPAMAASARGAQVDAPRVPAQDAPQGDQGAIGEGGEAGVVGMVRKLFGLG